MKGTSVSSHDDVNDSDDEFLENKLVIDLDSSMTEKRDKKEDEFAVPDSLNGEMTSGKSKAKRGAPKPAAKNGETNATAAPAKNSRSVKTEKNAEKATPQKTGRKRREKKDQKSPVEELPAGDPYKFESQEEGVASTQTGKKSKTEKSESVSMRDNSTDYDYRSIACITEPEGLGPCESGTHVSLEGIVWQETCNGVLVVNVTWKGKTYMGTLLDATKHDWTSSRTSCDSPIGELDGRTPKGRGKRSRVPLSDTFKDINERKLRKEMRRQSGQAVPPPSPAKSDNGKRKARNSESNETEPANKRGRVVTKSTLSARASPTLIECPEPNCGKKYKQMNGLRYHQRNAHQGESASTHDSLSDTEQKSENSSSPDIEVKKPKKKSSSKCDKPKSGGTDSPSDSKTLAELKLEQAELAKSSSTINGESNNETITSRSNTTSVITPTSSQLTVSHPTIPSPIVPVAAIPPQVMKPANNTEERKASNAVTPTSRTVSLAQPKLLPKATSTVTAPMAPISTLSAHSIHNPALKAIQPKPTILGETTPNPSLNDLRDQKKLKRKRSASKEDLVNGSNTSQSDLQKLGQSVQRISTEHEKMLATQTRDPSEMVGGNFLQSPSYSDISDEGEIRNMRRTEMLNNQRGSDSFGQSPYLVATVSPQKAFSEKERKPETKPLSPAPRSHSADFKKRELESNAQRSFQLEQQKQKQKVEAELHKQMQLQLLAAGSWSQDMMQHMLKETSMRMSVSPRPSHHKSSPVPEREKLSHDRMQLLKENMEMKQAMSSQSDLPRDYSIPSSSRGSEESRFNALMQDRFREDHHNQEKALRNHSPAGGNKPREDKMKRSSPMAPPLQPPFSMPHTFLPFPGMPRFTNPGMLAQGLNPMLAGFPGYPSYHGIPDMRDNNKRRSVSPSFDGKSSHKIHELQSSMRSAKSPHHPSPANDRQQKNSSMPLLGYNSQALPGGQGVQAIFPPK